MARNYGVVKRLLNVGGGSKSIPLPSYCCGYEHVLLDIDPRSAADMICDARRLGDLQHEQFDVVYCSHNLEHYYRHEVPWVLEGFLHVLKPGGFCHVRVPDIAEVMRITVARNMDIDDILYESPAGPIMVLDILYGYSVEIERSGEDFFAHKTGFTEKSLRTVLENSGFSEIHTMLGNLEITAIAFKGPSEPEARSLLGLPE